MRRSALALPRVAGGHVEQAVRPERDPAAVVDPGFRDASEDDTWRIQLAVP